MRKLKNSFSSSSETKRRLLSHVFFFSAALGIECEHWTRLARWMCRENVTNIGIRYDNYFVDLFAEEVDAFNVEFVLHVDLPLNDVVEIWNQTMISKLKKTMKHDIPMCTYTFLLCLDEELSDRQPKKNSTSTKPCHPGDVKVSNQNVCGCCAIVLKNCQHSRVFFLCLLVEHCKMQWDHMGKQSRHCSPCCR